MKYQIPRHLGLAAASKTKHGSYRLTFGYSDSLSKRVEVDAVGFAMLRTLSKPSTIENVAKIAKQSSSLAKAAIEQLRDAGLVKPVAKKPKALERYDRHLLFYDQQGVDSVEAQKRVGAATIALIGMGGIGSWVSMGLIGSGFEELRLIDFDTIELTNLTRQILYTEADLGRRKVDVAAERLRERNSRTKISKVHLELSGSREIAKALEGVDFVVLSADRPDAIHDWIDEACAKLSIPYLNVGYRDGLGVVGPLTKFGETACYQCFKPDKPETRTGSVEDVLEEFEARYQAPSFGPLNALASSVAVMEIMKSMVGFGEVASLGCELEIDPRSLGIRRTPYRRDPACRHCG